MVTHAELTVWVAVALFLGAFIGLFTMALAAGMGRASGRVAQTQAEAMGLPEVGVASLKRAELMTSYGFRQGFRRYFGADEWDQLGQACEWRGSQDASKRLWSSDVIRRSWFVLERAGAAWSGASQQQVTPDQIRHLVEGMELQPTVAWVPGQAAPFDPRTPPSNDTERERTEAAMAGGPKGAA